jgi:hypothetical protein
MCVNKNKVRKDLLRVYIACRERRSTPKDIFYWSFDDEETGYRYNRKTRQILQLMVDLMPNLRHENTANVIEYLLFGD